ncbi:MAG: hypothetical protein Q4D65_06140 [Peptostreptococcaceae bacterium]|nr:hypothetical protein [Peptostreptococcaceae bacterium]
MKEMNFVNVVVPAIVSIVVASATFWFQTWLKANFEKKGADDAFKKKVVEEYFMRINNLFRYMYLDMENFFLQENIDDGFTDMEEFKDHIPKLITLCLELKVYYDTYKDVVIRDAELDNLHEKLSNLIVSVYETTEEDIDDGYIRFYNEVQEVVQKIQTKAALLLFPPC